MKQMLLAAALVLVPAGVFYAGHRLLGAGAPLAQPLGDLAPLAAISHEVGGLIETGDLAAAELRATDFETLWDDREADLRPRDPAAWGKVDDAADALFHALRAAAPAPQAARAALAGLDRALADPAGAVAAGGGLAQVAEVAGIAVTDATGHPLSCEDLLGRLRDGLVAAPPGGDTLAQVQALQAKATERCNADDDTRANGFSAQALALLAG